MLAMFGMASIYWILSMVFLFNRISLYGIAIPGSPSFPITGKSEAFPMMSAIILLNVCSCDDWF
jgi:hypothetical protein